MHKLKRFLKLHYKKFVTVAVVSALAICLLVGQVFGAVYQYNMFNYYNNNVLESYWTHYVSSDGSQTGSHLIYQNATRNDVNNRFTATVSPADAVFYNHMYRFDLTIRFKEDNFTFTAGDVLNVKFHLSSNCQFITDKAGGTTGQFYLHFFRIWFEDDTTLIYYPPHYINYAYSVNDSDYDLTFPTLLEDKPRIVSMQFSFNLIEPVSYLMSDSTNSQRPYINIWFGTKLSLTVNRDPLNTTYPDSDDTVIKDHNKIEQDINQSISGGLDDATQNFQDLYNIFNSDTRLGRGVMFVTNIINRFFNMEIFSILGQFALSLGLFAFLIGIVQLVKSSAERNERNLDRLDRKELDDVYRWNNRHRG